MFESFKKINERPSKLINTKKIFKMSMNYRSIKEFTPQFVKLYSNYKNCELPKVQKDSLDSYIRTFRGYGTDEKEEEVNINKELRDEKEKYKKLSELIRTKKSFNLSLYNEKLAKKMPKGEYKLKLNKKIFIKTLNNFSLKKTKTDSSSLLEASKMITPSKPLYPIHFYTKRNSNRPLDLKTFYTNTTHTESKHSLLSSRQKIELDNYCDRLTTDAELIFRNTRDKFIAKSKDYNKYFNSLTINRNIVFKNHKSNNK